ncbi:diacylglyceryl transferase [Flavobacterium piscinae]|uniref:DUF6787 family protein n=1 Tax=Flavobacterium piscinae TaxID=2506424 RepID=UPI00199F00EB|nr:DUF6787 family protein [Flavobacterium piscinae]MBC8882466.1 diacylglyceryl transferase [Flavobacterium piscinae]
MKKLKARWGVTSNFQLVIIFIVFAITGSVSAYLSKPFTNYIGLTSENLGWLYFPIRLIVIFPIYQVLLVLFGFLFGQFAFFGHLKRKCFAKMKLGFILNWFEKSSKGK